MEKIKILNTCLEAAPTLSAMGMWMPSLTQRHNRLAAIPLSETNRTQHHPYLQDVSFRGSLIPQGNCSEIQCLQIIHLNLVPCELERGPSVLSTPQSQGHRWHQWSHKPPTVQREKTRLLQRRELIPHTPPQLRGPRRRKSQGLLHSGIHRAQGIPGTLALIPMGLEPTSRRVFLSSVLTNTRPSVD